jgi:hypothetical protein
MQNLYKNVKGKNPVIVPKEGAVLFELLWIRKTINVLMFTFPRMPGKMFPNL